MGRVAARRAVLFGVGIPVAALLLSASWLSSSYYLTTWLALILFFVLGTNCSRAMAFGVGAMIGGGASAIAFHWVPEALAETTGLPLWIAWCLYAIGMAYEAVPYGIIAMLASRWLVISPAWMWSIAAVCVVFEAYWPRVFSWSFAHSQTDVLPLLQIAEFAGAAGISFVIISVALIPAVLLRHARWRRESKEAVSALTHSGVAVALLTGVLVFGHCRLQAWEHPLDSNPALRVAIVQVDPSFNDSIAKMREFSQSADASVDLLCWPESTLGNYSITLEDFSDRNVTLRNSLPPIVDLQPTEGIDVQVLAGGKLFYPGANDQGPFFQVGFLILPDKTITGRYLKRTLMPIGEYVPGESIFPGLRQIAGLHDVITTGNHDAPLELENGTKVGVLMCYDDIVASNARKSVAEGAQLLITLANGSAFTNPVTLEQHMRLSLLRAVENRRFFVRCTATGVSCVITPTGKITQRLEPHVEGMLTADVAILDGRTVYNRFGFLFAPACLAFTLLILARRIRPFSAR